MLDQGGPTGPVATEADDYAESGRGLRTVSAKAAGWGWFGNDQARTVTAVFTPRGLRPGRGRVDPQALREQTAERVRSAMIAAMRADPAIIATALQGPAAGLDPYTLGFLQEARALVLTTTAALTTVLGMHRYAPRSIVFGLALHFRLILSVGGARSRVRRVRSLGAGVREVSGRVDPGGWSGWLGGR